MSESKRTVVHHHKLETSTKLILAAIAAALAIQAFGPWLTVRESKAESGSISMECKWRHPLVIDGGIGRRGVTEDCSGSFNSY